MRSFCAFAGPVCCKFDFSSCLCFQIVSRYFRAWPRASTLGYRLYFCSYNNPVQYIQYLTSILDQFHLICMELEPAKFTTFHLAIFNESSPKLISEYGFLVYYWSNSINLILIPTWKQSDLSQFLLEVPIYKFVDFSMV